MIIDQHEGCGGLWVERGEDPVTRQVRGVRIAKLSPGLASRPRWHAAAATPMSVWEQVPRTQTIDPRMQSCSRCWMPRPKLDRLCTEAQVRALPYDTKVVLPETAGRHIYKPLTSTSVRTSRAAQHRKRMAAKRRLV